MALAATAAMIGLIFGLMGLERLGAFRTADNDASRPGTTATNAGAKAAVEPRSAATPRDSAGEDELAARSAEPPADVFRFYEPVPFTHPSVAEGATVFVTTGPARAVRMGETVGREEIFAGLTNDAARVHIWDWSQSNRSRVISATVPRGAVLSPDGRLLLGIDGTVVDLAGGETRQLAGFAVETDQWMWSVRFSPSGRQVAALINGRSEVEQARRDPAQSSSRHEWALRIVELETGRIVDEFPSSGVTPAAFLPNETAVIYARPAEQTPRQDVVAHRDLARRETVVEYSPVYAPAEVRGLIDADRVLESVGIAVSADGRLTAAAYYYGQLFIWETASGKPVSHHLFLRADGSRDTFFQAKLMSFSPDGSLLALASGSRLKIVDAASARPLAEHYHETTPAFVHLRWEESGERITLVTPSGIGDVEPGSGFPPKVSADVFPSVYEWDWKSAPPVPRSYPEPESGAEAGR